MAADDKESYERRQSRSLRRDRGKRRRRHRSASPCPPKQRRKRSRSPSVEKKHKHKNSAEKHEARRGQELSTKNTEGMSEEDNGTEVAKKNGVDDDTEAGARKSSKEDRKVELRSIGDSSKDAHSNGESDRRRKKKKKSRSKSHQSRKSKSKHRGHVRSASQEDESPTEDTSGESSEDSAVESRRAKRRKQLKPKEKAEPERMHERRPKKEKVELRSIGDSSEGTYSEVESDRRRKKKSRCKSHQSRKSKSKHRGHVRSASEEDESPTEDTSGESSEDSADESRRAKRRKQLKPMEKAEAERLEDRRPKKEKVIVLKKRKMKEKEREQEKRMKKKEKVNLETLLNREEKDMLKQCREVERKGLRNGMGDQIVLWEDLQCHSRLGITEVCNEEKDHDVGDCLEGDNMHCKEASNDDPVLDPKHKIFLSHSGAQKEFVEHLCKALEDQMHYPFFDRRHESLPKGECFPELIKQAVEQCEMLIVVVSDEYFMSKWPMIELNAFVRAYQLRRESKNSTNGPKILPLFYGLSVRDLKAKSKQKKWFRRWETLAKADSKKRIVVSDWKYALEVLEKFNGIEYDANAKKILAYEREIVSNVCHSIAPHTKWDDSHVQGKSSIYKVLHEKIEGVGVSQEYNVKVVGIYGVGGIGKTTICKILCNKLWIKYEGRVCHIEFRSDLQFKYEEFVQKVVRDLTWKRMEVVQQLNEGAWKLCVRVFPAKKSFWL